MKQHVPITDWFPDGQNFELLIANLSELQGDEYIAGRRRLARQARTREWIIDGLVAHRRENPPPLQYEI